MRIALGVEYDGTGFHGWQTQRGVRTVQPALEAALSAIADEPVAVVCAGRTDSGVHACYQVVHFDSRATRSERSWVLGSNSRLPADVSVLWARHVPDDFHARFAALSRSYDYIILNRQTRPGVWHARVTWECRPLNPSLMHRGAQYWLGEHDFSSFRAKGCQARHPVREITHFDVLENDGFIVISVTANAFLQHMVRNFVGVLLEIGSARRPPEWAAEVLAERRRECAGVTARPDGLYLVGVTYPARFQLPGVTMRSPRFPAYTGPGFGVC